MQRLIEAENFVKDMTVDIETAKVALSTHHGEGGRPASVRSPAQGSNSPAREVLRGMQNEDAVTANAHRLTLERETARLRELRGYLQGKQPRPRDQVDASLREVSQLVLKIRNEYPLNRGLLAKANGIFSMVENAKIP